MAGIKEVAHPTLFRSSYHKASVNLAYTAFWLLNQQEAIVATYDLTWPQFCILSILRERYPYALTKRDMQDRLPHMTGVNMSLEAKKLVSRGWASYNLRTKKKEDRGFCATRDGLVLLTLIDKRHIRHIDGILSAITPEEAEGLSALLDRIRQD